MPFKLILKLALAICFLFASLVVKSQPYEIYQSKSIYLSRNGYILDGKEYKIGILGSKIKKEMTISEEAMQSFKIFQRSRKTSLFLHLGGLSSLLIANAVENRNASIGFFIGGIGLVGVGQFYSNKSSVHLNKAIWLRNGALFQ